MLHPCYFIVLTGNSGGQLSTRVTFLIEFRLRVLQRGLFHRHTLRQFFRSSLASLSAPRRGCEFRRETRGRILGGAQRARQRNVPLTPGFDFGHRLLILDKRLVPFRAGGVEVLVHGTQVLTDRFIGFALGGHPDPIGGAHHGFGDVLRQRGLDLQVGRDRLPRVAPALQSCRNGNDRTARNLRPNGHRGHFPAFFDHAICDSGDEFVRDCVCVRRHKRLKAHFDLTKN
ncbi:hypothetical protein R70006_06070 [Paraburkholderia domus]|nr:hypothetical protein R70006_06070 [Paraburkholderia domus]